MSKSRTAFSLIIGLLLGSGALLSPWKTVAGILATLALVIMASVPGLAYYALIATTPINVAIVGPLTVARLVAVSALVIMGVRAVGGLGPWPLSFRYRENRVFAVGFAAVVASAILLSHPDQVLPYLYYGVIFLTTSVFVRDLGHVRTLALVLIGVGVFEAALVLAEVSLQLTIPDRLHQYLATGRELGHRVVGTHVHPVLLAGFFQIVIALAIAAEFWPRIRRPYRAMFLGAGLIMAYAWWVTYGRSSILRQGAGSAADRSTGSAADESAEPGDLAGIGSSRCGWSHGAFGRLVTSGRERCAFEARARTGMNISHILALTSLDRAELRLDRV